MNESEAETGMIYTSATPADVEDVEDVDEDDPLFDDPYDEYPEDDPD